jgi:hypothetical protein
MNRPSTIVISDWLANCSVGQWTPFEAATALKEALRKEGYGITEAAPQALAATHCHQVLDDLANGRFEYMGDAVSAARKALAAAHAVVILPREKSDHVLKECGYEPARPAVSGEWEELAHKAAMFAEGTRCQYERGNTKGDMWFFELWHFLGDVEAALRAQPASPLRGIPTPEQIEPILDDFLGVDSPHYEELRRRCAQRIFDLCAVMSGISIKPSDNKISSGLTEDEKLARARALGQARAANKQPPTKDTSE